VVVVSSVDVGGIVVVSIVVAGTVVVVVDSSCAIAWPVATRSRTDVLPGAVVVVEAVEDEPPPTALATSAPMPNNTRMIAAGMAIFSQSAALR
jgi:hypothetical protein